MGFWDVFVKVWQVRTSVRIQESIENSFRKNRTQKTFDNFQEIVGALIQNNDSWQRKLNAHRTQEFIKPISLNCEFCGISFNIVQIKNNSNTFNGWVYYNNDSRKISDDLIKEITGNIKDHSNNYPLFFCSKKCILSNNKSNILNN
jgi:hypothetical protein